MCYTTEISRTQLQRAPPDTTLRCRLQQKHRSPFVSWRRHFLCVQIPFYHIRRVTSASRENHFPSLCPSAAVHAPHQPAAALLRFHAGLQSLSDNEYPKIPTLIFPLRKDKNRILHVAFLLFLLYSILPLFSTIQIKTRLFFYSGFYDYFPAFANVNSICALSVSSYKLS